MQKIIDTLNNFSILSKGAIGSMAEMAITKDYSKGATLLEQGKFCKQLYFLKYGFARGYYYQNGKDITTWFARENDIFTSMYAFITQKPCFESIEFLEASTIISISYENLQKLYHSFSEFNIIGRLLTEKYYVELEERSLSLQLNSAKERYAKLLETQPYILQKASLGQIASYLGMSQETLSRIRGK